MLMLVVLGIAMVIDPVETFGLIPEPLGAVSMADYSRDEAAGWNMVVDLSIIAEVIRDFSPRAVDIDLRVAEVYEQLKHPIPTALLPSDRVQNVPPAPTAPPPDSSVRPEQTSEPDPTATTAVLSTPTLAESTALPETPATQMPTVPVQPSATTTNSPAGNRAPVISGPAAQTVVSGSAYSFTPTASDPDGDKLSFSASSLPAWAKMNATSGRITGTPSYTDAGVTSVTITVSDGKLTASYSFQLTVTLAKYNLTITARGSGSVLRSPDLPQYEHGQSVTLTAAPDAGWSFSTWSGGFGSTNPVTITITGNTSLTATFVRRPLTLTLNVEGSGSISKSPNRPSYNAGDEVTLMANAAPGWVFVEWRGDVTGSENPAVLVMLGDSEVTAVFALAEFELNVQIAGQGTVTRTPALPLYGAGQIIMLQALPAPGWEFDSWSGDVTGTDAILQLALLTNAQVTANFIPIPILDGP
jgi:hypothetical protein